MQLHCMNMHGRLLALSAAIYSHVDIVMQQNMEYAATTHELACQIAGSQLGHTFT